MTRHSDFEDSRLNLVASWSSWLHIFWCIAWNLSKRYEGTMEQELLCVSVVPFGAADTCRKMWRSQMLNHSCPCVWLSGPRGETVKLLLWESGRGNTFCCPFILCTAVTLLLNLIFRSHLFWYRRCRIFYSRAYFLMYAGTSVCKQALRIRNKIHHVLRPPLFFLVFFMNTV